MKPRWTTSAVVLALMATLCGAAWAGESSDRAAMVNGSAISRKDLNREVLLLKERMAQQGRPIADDKIEAVRKDVLENMINLRLLVQAGKKKKIAVSDKEVEAQVADFRKRFGSDEEFQKSLAAMKLSDKELKAKIRENLTVRALIAKEIEEKLTVSEEQARAFYDEHQPAFQQPEQVHARHILVRVEPDADDAAKKKAREKIEGLQKRLEKGEDFAAVAKEGSEGPTGSRGGDLGFFKRGQMVKPFEEAAFALAPGQVSPPVETQFGYHLIQVVEKQPERMLPYEEARERIMTVLRREKTREEVEKYIQTLRQTAKIERF